MMVSYFRPGGLWRDVPDEFRAGRAQTARLHAGQNRRLRSLAGPNPIFLERARASALSPASRLSPGADRPQHAPSGVDWDNRRDMPYMAATGPTSSEVPVEHEGDVYARYRCRMREMRECLRLIRQGLTG